MTNSYEDLQAKQMRTDPLHGFSAQSSVGSVDFGDHPAWHSAAGNPSDDGVQTPAAAMHAISVVTAESEHAPPKPFCAATTGERDE